MQSQSGLQSCPVTVKYVNDILDVAIKKNINQTEYGIYRALVQVWAFS